MRAVSLLLQERTSVLCPFWCEDMKVLELHSARLVSLKDLYDIDGETKNGACSSLKIDEGMSIRTWI